MFTKNGLTYADAYKYLNRVTGNRREVALACHDATGYEELPMNSPLDVERCGNLIRWNNGLFATIIDKGATYGDIKGQIIKMRYSLDDQMAIVLNKDNSAEDLMHFDKMQEWRQFAGEVARKAMK